MRVSVRVNVTRSFFFTRTWIAQQRSRVAPGFRPYAIFQSLHALANPKGFVEDFGGIYGNQGKLGTPIGDVPMALVVALKQSNVYLKSTVVGFHAPRIARRSEAAKLKVRSFAQPDSFEPGDFFVSDFGFFDLPCKFRTE